VKDLTAERVGDVVRLRWTTPAQTTDRLDIKGPMTAELCRFTVSPTAPQPTCVPVTHLPVQPGLIEASDALPPAMTVDPAALLAYRLQILNAHGRSAGLSPDAFAPAGAAPSPVEQLRATPTRDGAMLEWLNKGTTAVVELHRLPVGPDGVVIEPAPPKAATKSSSKHTKKKPGEKPKKPAPAYHPPPGSKPPPPPANHYTALRVRSVSLGGHTLELRSIASPPVTVVMRNTFPPHTPTGLEAVPGGATAADRSIDLSWVPNNDADLAGYFVYRQEIDSKGAAAGTAERLNATPVVGPAYRDQTAVAGRRYAYSVAAVNTAGNISAPSDPIQETLREQ
jgi:hypothetical protein